jgi:hypothetical protein
MLKIDRWVTIRTNLIYIETRGNITKNFESIRNDLLATGAVENAALSNSRLLDMNSSSGGYDWEGKDPKSDVLITTEFVSP